MLTVLVENEGEPKKEDAAMEKQKKEPNKKQGQFYLGFMFSPAGGKHVAMKGEIRRLKKILINFYKNFLPKKYNDKLIFICQKKGESYEFLDATQYQQFNLSNFPSIPQEAAAPFQKFLDRFNLNKVAEMLPDQKEGDKIELFYDSYDIAASDLTSTLEADTARVKYLKDFEKRNNISEPYYLVAIGKPAGK